MVLDSFLDAHIQTADCGENQVSCKDPVSYEKSNVVSSNFSVFLHIPFKYSESYPRTKIVGFAGYREAQWEKFTKEKMFVLIVLSDFL